MKKLLTLALSMVLVTVILTGCTSSVSNTYKVGTGDTVKVTLDTSDGLKLEDGDDAGCDLVVTEDDETLLMMVFIDEDTYDVYMDLMEHADDTDSIEIIEEGSGDGIKWVFYNFDDGNAAEENNFIVWIKGSDTGLLMGSQESSRTAQRAFDSLSFEIVK